MEIRPRSDAAELALSLPGVIAELEQRIDKSEIEPITITSDEQKADVADAMIDDKRQIADVEITLKPYADLAYAIHRTITGKRGELQSYANARLAIRDRALVERAKEEQRIVDAENARLRDVARQQEEDRKKAEAEELKRRGKAEGRPDLIQRAKERLAEPVREIAITSSPSPTKQRLRGGVGGSVGLEKKYFVEVVDLDAFILAAARPHIYREVIAALTKKAKTAAEKKKLWPLLEPLRVALEDMPQIPLTTLELDEQRVKEVAKGTNGKVNWPGVAVAEDYGSRVRR